MSESVTQGMLVLADIGGYTRYLGGVELEHSHDILADLIGVVAGSLGTGLRVVKLEGDAVFCCGEGDSLLEALGRCHEAFTMRQRTIAVNTSCGCDACRQMTELDLKFVAHHGSFVEHEVAGSRELVGSDVIVVHRMLKNSIPADLGLRGYAFLSDACVAAASIDRHGHASHVERYPDIGPVAGVVVDLDGQTRDGEPVRLDDESADIVLAISVVASAQRAWDVHTDVREQQRWRVGSTSVTREGEPGVGSVTHCVHGRTTIDQEIVEWCPPHHFSYLERNPIGRCVWTIEITPDEHGGARIVWRVALAGGVRQRALYMLVGRHMRRVLRADIDSLAAYLDGAPGEAEGEAEGEGFEPSRRGSPA